MTKVWRTVALIALGVLAAGAVIAAAGWLTGASPDRILNAVFGGKENILPTAEKTLQALKDCAGALLTSLGL